MMNHDDHDDQNSRYEPRMIEADWTCKQVESSAVTTVTERRRNPNQIAACVGRTAVN